MIGYKVVNIINGKFYSFYTQQYGNYVDNILAVEYKLNEFVKPKVSGHPLTVFSTFDSARCFYTQHVYGAGNLAIYEVEYTQSNIPYTLTSLSLSMGDIDIFIEDVMHNDSFMHRPPKNTVFASEVKLLKEVTHDSNHV